MVQVAYISDASSHAVPATARGHAVYMYICMVPVVPPLEHHTPRASQATPVLAHPYGRYLLHGGHATVIPPRTHPIPSELGS